MFDDGSIANLRLPVERSSASSSSTNGTAGGRDWQSTPCAGVGDHHLVGGRADGVDRRIASRCAAG
jgi:hypothetical protein